MESEGKQRTIGWVRETVELLERFRLLEGWEHRQLEKGVLKEITVQALRNQQERMRWEKIQTMKSLELYRRIQSEGEELFLKLDRNSRAEIALPPISKKRYPTGHLNQVGSASANLQFRFFLQLTLI